MTGGFGNGSMANIDVIARIVIPTERSLKQVKERLLQLEGLVSQREAV